MLNFIESIDHTLFTFFNKTIGNPLFDWIFPNITDLHKQGWFVKFLLPLIIIFWFYRHKKKALRVLVCLTLTIALVDYLSAQHLKAYFKRSRPPNTKVEINLRTDHYAGYSLPSNHAINIFSLATVISYYYPPARIFIFATAILTGYSRIYVGVHFPFDVLAGALLGIFLSLLTIRIYERALNIINKKIFQDNK